MTAPEARVYRIDETSKRVGTLSDILTLLARPDLVEVELHCIYEDDARNPTFAHAYYTQPKEKARR